MAGDGTQRDGQGKPRIHAWLKVGDEWVRCDVVLWATGGVMLLMSVGQLMVTTVVMFVYSWQLALLEPPVFVFGGFAEDAILFGHGDHLGATLDAGMSPDRHQPTALAADESTGQSQVDDCPDAIFAEGMLRDPHAPDENGGIRGGEHAGDETRQNRQCCEARCFVELIPGCRGRGCRGGG